MTAEFDSRPAMEIPPATGPGPKAALVFALVAHQLSTFYENGHWMTVAQGATLCGEWSTRRNLKLTLSERRHLSTVGSDLAESIRSTLSREAGLYTAHELMESLDARYESELGRTFMAQCAAALGSDAPD